MSGHASKQQLAELEQRITASIAQLESKVGDKDAIRSDAAAEALREFNKKMSTADEGPSKEDSCCWRIVKIMQYLFGITIGLYALFITFYGLFNGHSVSSPDLHPALVIIFLVLLITILAFCEGTQIAIMLLEKVPLSDLENGDWMCSNRVRRTHELANANTERYLVGRQIFVTGIVFLIAKMISMKHSYAATVSEELGWLGNEYLIGIFVHTGLAGSLIVLAFGQLLPQLIVTTTPILQYQLFPTYELVWIQLLCERMGVAEMANILRSFTIWLYDLVDEPFGVGSGVKITSKQVGGDAEAGNERERSKCTTYWLTWPSWWQVIKVIIGVAVFCASIFSIIYNVISGNSDFTRVQRDADNVPILVDGQWVPLAGDINIFIQLLLFIPLSNIAMGFLEGSQIAILALEKAPGRTIKRIHREAYFGHRVSQQRDNVRRYLLGRQFLVVFVDFIAAHTMGMGGLGILVPVSQLYPQLLAASNPMWFLGTWGSKCILLLALGMEFLGFCHFSWSLFTIFFVIKNLMAAPGAEDGFAVGKAVDIAGEDMGGGVVNDVDELQRIVIEQQQKIQTLERIISAPDSGAANYPDM